MITTLRSSAVGAVVLGLSIWFSSTAGAAGSIAVGKCGVDGYSYNQGSVQEAEETALQNCGPGCSVVLHFENACGAFATDVNKNCGAQGWGWAAERGKAEDIAIRECINQSGENCAVKRWVCDGG
jgi:hypothetical protein